MDQRDTDIVYKFVLQETAKYKYKGLDIEDLAQDTMLAILQSPDFEEHNHMVYACGYIRNKVRTAFTKLKRERKKVSDYIKYKAQDIGYEDYVNKLLVDQYTSILDKSQKNILRMSYWEDRSDSEIGEIVDKSKYQIYNIRNNALEQIRQRFNIKKKYYNLHEQIIKDLKDGLGFKEIVRLRSVNIKTVKKLAQTIGIKPKLTAKIQPIPKNTLVKMLEENNGIVENVVANIGNVSKPTVYRWMAKYNIDVNSFRRSIPC